MRILLLPISILYGIVVKFRNLLFDVGVFKEHSFNSFVINVGNLSAGGTGKSPHVIYLIEQLSHKYKVAVLSRGYGRTSKGFRWVKSGSSSIQVGDEPLQYVNLFKNIDVAVCESRVAGINQIEKDTQCDIIILDDAFQHRYVKPDFNILITDYSELFFNDLLLPAGRLRESRKGASRADVVIVSKSPENISQDEVDRISNKISSYGINQALFSYMRYSDTMEFSSGEKMSVAYLQNCDVIIVAGIAKPQPLVDFVRRSSKSVTEFIFRDHHQFTSGEIIKIKECYQGLIAKNNGPVVIVTTRKDWMRLNSPELKHLQQSLPIAVLDIEVRFHQSSKNSLVDLVEQTLGQKRK